MISLARELFYLARETVGAISEGVALGLKIAHDESPAVDQITHGPKWLTGDELPPGVTLLGQPFEWYGHVTTSSTDGAVTDPVVESGPAAAASATDAAAGHPMDDDLKRLLFSAAWGLRQWMIGETCGAPTLFKSIAHDLEDLSK